MCDAERKLEKLQFEYDELKAEFEEYKTRYENSVVYYKQSLTNDKDYPEMKRNPEDQFGIMAKEFWKKTKAFDLTQVHWLKGVYNRHTIIHVINHMQILDDDFKIGQLKDALIFKNDNEIGILCPLGLHEDNQKELDEVWDLIKNHKAKIVVILNKADLTIKNSEDNCDRGFSVVFRENKYVKEFWAKTDEQFCILEGKIHNCDDCDEYYTDYQKFEDTFRRCHATETIIEKEEIEGFWLQIPYIKNEISEGFRILTIDCSDQLV